MKARDLMTSDHLWAAADTSDAREVAKMMQEHNVGSIPVLDQQGRLEGIVTDRDICCRLVAKGGSYETPVREIMSKSVKSVRADADLSEVERIMTEQKIRRLPVVDKSKKLQGFISIADLSRHCGTSLEEHEFVHVMEEVSAPASKQ